MSVHRKIAYFSMEIGIESAMSTYSGGLGILAGDTIRAAADLQVPLVAITLVHRKGYFRQRLDEGGWQREEPADWDPARYLIEVPVRETVTIEERIVTLRAWLHVVYGETGYAVPVYFLDTDLTVNSAYDRSLTDSLYGGDSLYRLCQEVVLGIGGVKMLRALGHAGVQRYHMNEGHAALITWQLLIDQAEKGGRNCFRAEDVEAVRRECIFTTHTPVPAGHDQFPAEMVNRVFAKQDDLLGAGNLYCAHTLRTCGEDEAAILNLKETLASSESLNMTHLALRLSHYVNGVAKKHGQVSSHMFSGYTIDSITNGVHAATWASPPFQALFDRHIPEWKQDNFSLRYALNVSPEEIWQAHQEAKALLLQFIRERTGVSLDADFLTIGFARRATAYKRFDLFFSDPDRIRKINSGPEKLQIVFAGKAHPADQEGKEHIHRISQARTALSDVMKIVYLEDYDMGMARLLTAGVDLWLNTPEPPMEASGTSGMKAAVNGVPSLSVLDGWWIEGCIEGVTGWAIGEEVGAVSSSDRSRAAASLYEKLEDRVLPMFYHERANFIDIMRHAIALNGSFFNAHRMVQQYVLNAYFR